MLTKLAFVVLLADSTLAFPWVLDQPNIDSSLFAGSKRQTQAPYGGPDAVCPNNPVHPGAAPITTNYPYLGAKNGDQSTLSGGIRVPAVGDEAHYFTPPGPLDIRGPCPGLNTLANHNFLSHDGITTYNELVDAQQNVYNAGWDLANLLAIAGVYLTGDPVTRKMSIGCEATSRTAATGSLLGTETGLDGHNKFEGDTSLTRDDKFLGNGDNYSFNGTLFGMMEEVAQGNYSVESLGLYRYQRYLQSRADNANFFFGPGSLLLYGAASFLYKLFPTNGGPADLATQMSFFGVNKTSSGDYVFNNAERIPAGWVNRNTTCGGQCIGQEIGRMYQLYPVDFGGNIGQDNFNGMNYSTYIVNGKLNPTVGMNFMCFIYQTLTAGFPTGLSSVYLIPANTLGFALGKLEPGYKNLGCPGSLYPSNEPVVGDSGTN